MGPAARPTGMILYPAIDLKDGECVRLLRGEMTKATVFNKDPAAQARAFADKGCEWVHVVDLDGATAGRPVNQAAIEAILKSITIPIQLGGGLRDLDTIDAWLAAGITRAILGTAALRNPELVREACRRHPKRIAVGIDARDGFVAIEGWTTTSTVRAIELGLRLRALKTESGAGIEGVICGRALYDGRIDPAAAVKLLRE